MLGKWSEAPFMKSIVMLSYLHVYSLKKKQQQLQTTNLFHVNFKILAKLTMYTNLPLL